MSEKNVDPMKNPMDILNELDYLRFTEHVPTNPKDAWTIVKFVKLRIAEEGRKFRERQSGFYSEPENQYIQDPFKEQDGLEYGEELPVKWPPKRW